MLIFHNSSTYLDHIEANTMDMLSLINLAELTESSANLVMNITLFSALALLLIYEFSSGKYRFGKRTKIDWQMTGLSFAMLAIVQRPLIFGASFLSLSVLFSFPPGELRSLNQEYFLPCLVAFLLIDEFLHGGVHYFSHTKTPNNKFLAAIHGFIRKAHRPHHLHGGNDGKGELSAAHAPVENWAFLFILPNYWFGAVMLYLGWIEVFLIGNLIKTLWIFHVHTNWNYDLYFLNHKNKFVQKTMFALCHIFTFPTQHHQHHSRSKNSAKNMQNFLAVYDWLFWGTLSIEKERPKIYGWKQTPEEEKSAFHRYFGNSTKKRAAYP